MPDPFTTVRDELAAMRKIAAALDGLDPAARDRIAGWVFDRFRKPTDDEEPTDA